MNILKKGFLLVAIVLMGGLSHAQTVRTDVLIAGNTESGLAAAIQAAHSGVKALYIIEGNELPAMSEKSDTLSYAGVSNDFSKLMLIARKDTVTGILNPFSPSLASSVLKGWTDTIKNLTIMRNAVWQKIEESGKGWDIKLKDGKTLKVNVVVDATINGALAAKAGIPYDPSTGYYKTIVPFSQVDIQQPYNNRLYRTTAGIGISGSHSFIIPLGLLVAAGKENFILAGKLPVFKTAKQLEAGTIASGQAAGTAAAYCSFFKTSTKSLNVRIIQGELFAYRSWLMPFADIPKTDSNFSAIQRIGISGLLKGSVTNGGLFFNPDSTVSAEAMRAPMKEFYSRSQLWFADNKIEKFTLGSMLSLIKFTASRGEELNKEVEKAWKTSFKFAGDFDLNRVITKREFAVLADAYLKPFNVRVDLNGFLGS